MLRADSRLGMAGAAIDRCRIALGVTDRAVAAGSIMVLRKTVVCHFDLFPPFLSMALAAVIIRSLVNGWRRMAVGAHKFQSGQTLCAVALAAVQSTMSSHQLYRMIKSVLGPGHFRCVAAAAKQRHAVRADMTSGAVVGTSHFVFSVALLAILARHYSACLGWLMFGDFAVVAACAGERRVPMRAVLWSVANTAIAYLVVLGRGGYGAGRADVDQAPMAVRALLLVVLGMCHAQCGAQTCIRPRFPGVAA